MTDFNKLSFSIGDPSKLLEILRSKMYSDPISAICREISCNARDAHREVNTPERPIQIFLPSENDNYLRIKDFGPGISQDRMKNVYLNYTNTTKEGTDQTGGFGLGAKTPFSYTNSFSIVTCVDGIKYHYIAYIDETDIGAIFLLDQNDTKEQNGTEVVIPVDYCDFIKFTNALTKVFAFWTVKPQIIRDATEVCLPYKNFSGSEVLLSNNNWQITKKHSEISIIIDEIMYPVDTTKVDIGNLDQVGGGLNINVDPGTITLSSTRENVYYNNRTIDALEKLFDDVAEDIFKVSQEKIDNCENLLDALSFYSHYHRLFDWFGDICYNDHNLNDIVRKMSRCNRNSYVVNDSYTTSSYIDLFDSRNKVVVCDVDVRISRSHAKKISAATKYKYITIISPIKGAENPPYFNDLFPDKLSNYCRVGIKNNSLSKRITVFQYNTVHGTFKRTSRKKLEECVKQNIAVKIYKDYHNRYLSENHRYESCYSDLIKDFGYNVVGYKEDLNEDELSAIFGEDYISIDEAIDKVKITITEEEYVHYLFCVDKLRELSYNKYYRNIDFYKKINVFDKTPFKALSLCKEALSAGISSFINIGLAKAIYPDVDDKVSTYKPINNFADIKSISSNIDYKFPMLKFISIAHHSSDCFDECIAEVSNYISSRLKEYEK